MVVLVINGEITKTNPNFWLEIIIGILILLFAVITNNLAKIVLFIFLSDCSDIDSNC